MGKWLLIYEDGKTISSEEATPKETYGFRLLGIVQEDPSVGTMTMHGWDFYYWVEEFGQWWGSNIHGYLDRQAHRKEAEFLIWGCNVDNRAWSQFLDAAKKAAAENFPPKTGFRSGETPFVKDGYP